MPCDYRERLYIIAIEVTAGRSPHLGRENLTENSLHLIILKKPNTLLLLSRYDEVI